MRNMEVADKITNGLVANLLRCKKEINIARTNTRTIREQKGQVELTEHIKKAHITIMGIQEHRIVHSYSKNDALLRSESESRKVEDILFCEAWALSAKEEASLDECYARMLRMVMNVTWRDKVRNEVLYDNLPRVTEKIRERRLKLAGHCIRHNKLEASDLVLWEPIQGKTSRGSQKQPCVDILRRDTGLNSSQLDN
ncbi:hypothetical protein CAPTEDRAFT_197577 [Capitella teleta]|uniref:Uncharacterized protein n=1 Tax=Capitella teleta TaxID=283909 RepID=R7U302_CAPTE|nr:hypothetical protein CAPTEDRAFT_197577 [Capitella teleta]|eukprot:ELT98051.1 hypothetical protein CAPTEDRAFT_197577 [Capitella teleta]